MNLRGFFGSYTDLQPSQKWAVLSPLIPVVPGLILAIHGPSWWAILGFIIPSILAIAIDKVNRYTNDNIVNKNLSRIMSHQRDLHYIGDTYDGIDWFLKNHHGAKRVINTVFNRSDSDVFLQEDDNIRKYWDVARNLLNNKCIWTDICLNSEALEIGRFQKTLSAEQALNYKVVEIESKLPLLQCLIIFYGADESCILFGWGFHGSDKSRVFVSHDSDTVDYFNQYFRSLRQSQAPSTQSYSRHIGPEPGIT